MSRTSVGWVIPVSQVLRYWGILGKLCPSTLNHLQRHTKSNPKTSSPHLTLNEVLLLCQGHLRVQLYLSYGYLSVRAIWGKLGQNTPNHVYIHTKSNPKFSASHYTLNEFLLKCQGIWGLIYTCFRVFGVLGLFRETGPQYPNFSKIAKFYYLD